MIVGTRRQFLKDRIREAIARIQQAAAAAQAQAARRYGGPRPSRAVERRHA